GISEGTNLCVCSIQSRDSPPRREGREEIRMCGGHVPSPHPPGDLRALRVLAVNPFCDAAPRAGIGRRRTSNIAHSRDLPADCPVARWSRAPDFLQEGSCMTKYSGLMLVLALLPACSAATGATTPGP